MKTIDELLIEVGEDKMQNLSTTSFKFKKDIWEYFQNYQDKIAFEFGTHKGQTTRILSYLFKRVYTVNNSNNETAKEFNKDRNNIIYINFDLYSRHPLVITEKVDMFLIDAGHNYDQVKSDISRVFSMLKSNECYVVFDDYGIVDFEEHVRKAINEAINDKKLEFIKGIGHKSGFNFGNGNKGGHDRILGDHEGVITKVI